MQSRAGGCCCCCCWLRRQVRWRGARPAAETGVQVSVCGGCGVLSLTSGPGCWRCCWCWCCWCCCWCCYHGASRCKGDCSNGFAAALVCVSGGKSTLRSHEVRKGGERPFSSSVDVQARRSLARSQQPTEWGDGTDLWLARIALICAPAAGPASNGRGSTGTLRRGADMMDAGCWMLGAGCAAAATADMFCFCVCSESGGGCAVDAGA